MDNRYDAFSDFYLGFVQRGLENPLSVINLALGSILGALGEVRGKHICDLACGEGYLSRALADRGAHVTGVDLSEALLGYARGQAGGRAIQFVQDDAQGLQSLEDEAFDCVVCCLALMDIPDLEPTFQSVRRVLRQGGSFIFVVLHPCFESPFNQEEAPTEIDEQGNFVACRVMRYLEEGYWNSGGEGVRGHAGAYHRTISTYLNAVLRNSFRLVKVGEPALPPGAYSDAASQRTSKIAPLLLVIGQAE